MGPIPVNAKAFQTDPLPIIPSACTNDSDYQTDYVMSDTVRLFEDHPLYAAARARAESLRNA